MLDWIAGFIGRWAGTVDNAVRDLVHWAVHALASVVYAVFGLVGDAWRGMLGAGEWLAGNIGAFAGEVSSWIWHIIRKIVPFLAAWITRVWNDLLRLLRAVEAWAWREIRAVEQLAVRLVDDVRQWAYRDIWLPLTAAADWLRTHLIQWGYTAWWYVTHPAQLAALLGDPLVDWLEANSWSVARRLGSFTLALVLHNTRRLASTVEDIVAAIL